MHEVIVDYEYRPVVAGVNGLIDIKWTGGVLLLRKNSWWENVLGPVKDDTKSSAREKPLNWKEGR